jgi:hypothetical protein
MVFSEGGLELGFVAMHYSDDGRQTLDAVTDAEEIGVAREVVALKTVH